MNYTEHIDKINNKERYSFSRFGDGEWNAILEKKGFNCDGHHYFTDMGVRLKEILEETPDYYIGLQNLAKRTYPVNIQRFTNDFNLTWSASDIFHNASINNNLKPLLDALETRNVVLVGGEHLEKFNKKYRFIKIPSKDCWLKHKETLTTIQERLLKHDVNENEEPKSFVILFCASMMSNVLIDELHNLAKQPTIDATLIDIGSVFDMYVGVNSRSYMRNKNK